MSVDALPAQSANPDLTRIYGQSEESAPTNQLGKDAFLKLLVAQLKYQDPMNPSSSEDFIATTAQFTMVEKLDELAKQGRESATVNALTTASALIGKEITITGSDGRPQTAVVERTQIIGGEVTVITDLGPISLARISGISDPVSGQGVSGQGVSGKTEKNQSSIQPGPTTGSISTSTESDQPGARTTSPIQETAIQETVIQEKQTETPGTDAVDAVTPSPNVRSHNQ